MKKIAVLSLSGGMDSTSLLLHLLNRDYLVYCVSFSYGQKHVIELDRVKQNIQYLQERGFQVTLGIINLQSVIGSLYTSLIRSDLKIPKGEYTDQNMRSTVVPNRNAIFSSIVYAKALSLSIEYNTDSVICLGTHSGDHVIYPDCRPEFHEVLDYAFKIGNWGSERVTTYLPYLEYDKSEILSDALSSCFSLGLNFNKIFSNTITCYSPDEEGRSCGECGSCKERLDAFNKLELKDPIVYVK